MEHDNKIRWESFVKSLTWGDCLKEFLDALRHLEQYRDANPTFPANFVPALAQLRTIGDHLRAQIDSAACCEELATPEAANIILAMTRRIKREVPTVEHIGNA